MLEKLFEDELGIEKIRVKDKHREEAQGKNGLPDLDAPGRNDGDDEIKPNIGEDTP